MWIPSTVDELKARLRDGMPESPWLDGKLLLGKPAEAAKDVAAMANEGGVLIYGVGEDDEKRLVDAVPMPDVLLFEERLANAVRDIVHNPPFLDVRILEDPPGSGRGYAVVTIPKSPFAPHMVEGAKEGRFYGRLGTTTARLTGAQVDQLLHRRQMYGSAVADAVSHARKWRREPPPAVDDRGQLTLLVQPTIPSPDTAERAAGEGNIPSAIADAFKAALQAHPFSKDSGEALRRLAWSDSWQRGADIFVGLIDSFSMAWSQVEAEVSRDGALTIRRRGAVVFRRISNMPAEAEGLYCADFVVGPSVVWGLRAAGELMQRASALSQVRCVVHIDGLRGATSGLLKQAVAVGRVDSGLPPPAMLEDEYQRSLEVSVRRLAEDPAGIAHELLKDLWEALTQGEYPAGHHPLDL